MLDKLRPPKFEIEDLCMPKSDPLYHNAVRCVQTYWKQAANMTKGQCQKYLWYLKKTHIKHFVAKPFECAGGTVTAHGLYQRTRDDAGHFVKLSWPIYLLLASLYEDLPQRYEEAIVNKYGTSAIEDHTIIYRHFYPVPTSTIREDLTESTTAQAQKNDFIQETPIESTEMDAHKSVKSGDEDCNKTATVVDKIDDDTCLENRDPPSATPAIAPSQGSWNIDEIIDALTIPMNKRSSSASESSPKRTKLGHDEILKHLDQFTEITQKIIHEAQLGQHSKLQEVHHGVEKSLEILENIQNDLRQFMSAVASTLKDIREQLDE